MKYTIRDLIKRTDTTWEASFYHRDKLTNKRIVSYHTIVAATRQTAERKRDELRFQLEQKGAVSDSTMTVEELMTAYVDYKAASGTIESATVKGYRCDTRTCCKYIGHIKITELKISDVDKFMADALEDGLSPVSVGKPFRLLKSALKYAVANDVLQKNVCDFCTPPKRKTKVPNALSRSEAARMLQLAYTARPEYLATAIFLGLTMGLRRGEVCGLMWSDIDFEKHQMRVQRAVGDGDGGYYLKDTKSHKPRELPIPDDTYALLKEIRDGQIADYKRLKHKAPDCFVCGPCEKDGKHCNPTNLGKSFATFAKMNGFDCTFHDLRHTFATLVISQGVDIRTVSSLMGHASTSMTLDVYAAPDAEAKQAASKKISGIFALEKAKQGAELIAERLPEPPMVESPLLTQEAPAKQNPALELLFSDASEALSDAERLFLLNLAKKCV